MRAYLMFGVSVTKHVWETRDAMWWSRCVAAGVILVPPADRDSWPSVAGWVTASINPSLSGGRMSSVTWPTLVDRETMARDLDQTFDDATPEFYMVADPRAT